MRRTPWKSLLCPRVGVSQWITSLPGLPMDGPCSTKGYTRRYQTRPWYLRRGDTMEPRRYIKDLQEDLIKISCRAFGISGWDVVGWH